MPIYAKDLEVGDIVNIDGVDCTVAHVGPGISDEVWENLMASRKRSDDQTLDTYFLTREATLDAQTQNF